VEKKIVRAHGLFVAAAFAALASTAQAQTAAAPAPAAAPTSTVQVYGLMDMYVERRTNMSPDGGDRWLVNSGGMNTSRLGFRGTEDLGAGLKALFQLEAEVVMDTGASGSAFWGRQAWVGLEGGFGRLIAGRSYSSTYDFIIAFDPLGYAPNYSWATSAGAAGGGATGGARKDGMVTGVSNMLKYRIGLGPVTLGAMLAAGEGNGSKVYGLAANYAAGPLALAATWEQVEAVPAGDETTAVHVGATLALGDSVKLFAAIRDYDKEYAVAGAGGSHDKSRTWWLGANYLPIAPLTLTAAYYQQNIRAGKNTGGIDDPSMIVLRARYALSKRTDLHLTLGHAEADGAPVSLSRDDTAFGGTQDGVTVGIQHRF
jgi:predicted porin